MLTATIMLLKPIMDIMSFAAMAVTSLSKGISFTETLATPARDLYNYSSRLVFTGTVTDYWLSYNDAQNAMDYYCPIYGKGTKREFKVSTVIQQKN